MTDETTLLVEDEEAVDDEEVVDTLESEEEPSDEDTDPVASLKAELERVKAQLEKPAWLNELKTIEGRVRSAEARLQKAEDPAERATLRSELESKINASNNLMAKMLAAIDDDLIDPSVKAEARRMLAEAEERTREEELLKRLRSEFQPAPTKTQTASGPTWYTSAVQTWEEQWVESIEDEGFDSSASGDFSTAWKSASQILKDGGSTKDASTFMRNRLRELREERETAKQRQTTKSKASPSPRTGSVTANPLKDRNASRADQERELAKRGIYIS